MSKIEELLRLVDRLRRADGKGVAQPQNWTTECTDDLEQLLELVKMQHEALAAYPTHGERFMEHLSATTMRGRTLEAFDVFDKGVGK